MDVFIETRGVYKAVSQLAVKKLYFYFNTFSDFPQSWPLTLALYSVIILKAKTNTEINQK